MRDSELAFGVSVGSSNVVDTKHDLSTTALQTPPFLVTTG